jgi:glyoxylase-like metal-dependent hydrolase (beta-lactamase superfamily II)
LTTITPLEVARLAGIPASVLRHGDRSGESVTVPVHCYLVEPDSGGPVLFDLGCYPPDRATATGRVVLDHRTPADAVRAAGRDPAEVEQVVVSHLHWDHCVGIAGFANARMLVQREELRFAFAPEREQWHPYDSWELGRRAPWLDDLDRIEPVSGHRRLGDDLLVVPTPGHTPGSQSLLVHADRDYLLCGDLIGGYQNWPGTPEREGAPPAPVPPGIASDLAQWRCSIDLLERHDWLPLPAHEPSVADVLTGAWPPPRLPGTHL